MEYSVDYFIEKFAAIPDEQWCVGSYVHNEKRCAYGFCGVNTIADLFKAPEAIALTDIIKLISDKNPITMLENINNGYHKRFIQPTPKARILAALNYIKSLNDGK